MVLTMQDIKESMNEFIYFILFSLALIKGGGVLLVRV